MKPEDITAWALDELTPEERAQIEAAQAGTPTLQKQASDTKAFCHLLGEHLMDEDAALTTEQREALKAIELPKAGNIVAFITTEEPARMNGKAFHAKVTAARERMEPQSSPWMRIAALAACLMFVVVVINQAGKTDKQVVAEQQPSSTADQAVAVTISSVANEGKQKAENKAIWAAQPGAVVISDSKLSPTPEAFKDLLSQSFKGDLKPSSPAVPTSISSTGDISKSGTGTFTLSGANTFTGGTPVNAGEPLGGAVAINGGTLAYNETEPSPWGPGKTVDVGGVAIIDGKDQSSSGSFDKVDVNRLMPPLPSQPPSAKPAAVAGSTATYSTSGLASAPAVPGAASRAKQSVALLSEGEMRKREHPAPEIPQLIVGGRISPVEGTERYAKVIENPFLAVQSEPLSTFSIDVDTGSYANVRRFLNEGRLPPPDAVRLEEMINYFPYDYEQPADKAQPFSVHVDLAEAPWAPQHRLARVAIKGRDVGLERKAANFVFLVDVSGSMNSGERLPLVKQSLEMLTEQLGDEDRVSIVTYAGECKVALESTVGSEKQRILKVIRSLHSGGSTNGQSGIEMAYDQAAENFIKGGINRVILCTDGDFNVGISDPKQLEKLIKEKAKSGTFLSVLGYGTGNLQDRTMETLADNGNGNYAYIDSLGEARKVLVEQMHGTLITIAKDVKIQVEFNPTVIASYRLIGYEKRMLATQDFNNDKKDAGEIGAGHTVTALYELIPVGLPMQNGALASVDPLRYQQKKPEAPKSAPMLNARSPQEKLEGINDETMTVKLRYKEPEGQLSKLIEVPVRDAKKSLNDSPRDFRFATAIAGFGMLLRDSEHVENFSFDAVRKLALSGKGEDALGYRGEFIQLVDKAKGLKMTGQR